MTKPHRLALFGLLTLAATLRAQPEQVAPVKTPSVKTEAARLIQQDAVRYLVIKPAKPAAPEETTGELLYLAPITVRGRRPLVLPVPLRENKVEEFFRTGTILPKVGPFRLWAKGDMGIMLSMPW
jgi:hypothetical protein